MQIITHSIDFRYTFEMLSVCFILYFLSTRRFDKSDRYENLAIIKKMCRRFMLKVLFVYCTLKDRYYSLRFFFIHAN